MTDSEKGSLPQAAVHLEGEHGDDPIVLSTAEKRLIRKQDLVITSLMSGCFFFAYLVCV